MDVSHHLKKISHYIDKMAAKGYGKEYIQKELLAVGWPKELVKEGLSKIKNEVKKEIKIRPHFFGRLLFILIILMIIGVYVLLLFNEVFVKMINYVAYWSLYIILGLLVVSLIVLLRPLPIYEKIKNAYMERRKIINEKRKMKKKEKIRIALEKKRREAEELRLKKEEKRKSKEERIKRILEKKRIREEEKRRKISEKKTAKEEKLRLKKEEEERRKIGKLKPKAERRSVFLGLFKRREEKKELPEKGKEERLKLKEEEKRKKREEKERRKIEKLKEAKPSIFLRLFGGKEERLPEKRKRKEEKIRLKEEKRLKKEERKKRKKEEKVRKKEEKKKLKGEEKKLKKEEKELKREEKLRLKEEKREEKERRREQKWRLEEEKEKRKEEEEKQKKEEKTHLVRVIPKALKIEMGKYDTDLDVLHKIIEKSGRIKLSAISRYFGVNQKKAEEWATILQEHKLAEIHYPPVGEPELKKIREPKKYIKIPKP